MGETGSEEDHFKAEHNLNAKMGQVSQAKISLGISTIQYTQIRQELSTKKNVGN
jgi:hypothetical protein